MAVSPKILKAAGCTPKDWKPLFTALGEDKLPQIKKLESLLQNRIHDGQTKNLAEYRTFAAIDLAYDVPFAQTTPTIVQNLLGRKWEKTEDLLAQLQQWGLKEEELFLKTTLPGSAVPVWVVNPPTFFKVLVPLVKSYITIRWAKLFNDRNQSPLLPYDPLQPNDETRMLCDILTYMTQVTAADYGYANVLSDVIFQTLMYATCLSFPMEVWHSESQKEMVGAKEKEVTQKEGIRYSLPHPTRMFWDLNHPIYTFNTDSGCEFAGYWKVVRYGDILDNPNYWNRRNIGYSSKQWGDPAFTSNFFQEVYPCRMEWPVWSGGNDTSREQNLALYATNQRDMAVSETNIFMKLVPSKWKLGTYKNPIWIRFVVASDRTVIYAEPCCYPPVLYSGYDSNSLRSKNSSMALEIIPTQDIVGNILSQILLTCKQNLANVIFYDINVVNQEYVDKLKNSGEMLFRSMNLIGFDSRKMAIAGTPSDKAFNQVVFAYKDVQPLFQSLNTMLSMLERLLQLSAQESGAAASHQQSKAEIDVIANSTSNRVMFTGHFIDDFMDAWKWQLYEASMAYKDDEVEAYLPADIPDIEQKVKSIGFQIIGTINGEGKLLVRGSKKHLKLNALAVSGKGPERLNNAQVAQVMLQTVAAIAANPELAKLIGPKTILKMYEKSAILSGADKDFQLRPDQKAQVDLMQQMAQQIQIACARQAEDKIAKPAAEHMAKLDAEVKGLDMALQKIITQLGLGQPPAQGTPTNAPINTPQPIADHSAVPPAGLPAA